MTNFHAINEKNQIKYTEKLTRGTTLQPVAKYHTEIDDLLPFYPIHWHEEMEIIKVQEGCGLFCVDGVKYEANDGDIIILRPFAMHFINRIGEHNMKIDAVVINLRLLEAESADVGALKYLAPLLNERHSVPCIVRQSDSWYKPFNDILTSLLAHGAADYSADPDVKTNLYSLFYHLYNNRLAGAKPNVSEDKRCYTVRRALEYIRAEYMNEIVIANIAKHCGYSEFYLMKLFKQYTGVSIVDYANDYRLTVAGRQLRDTDDDIATIAYQVGFNNISYFDRQFKRLYGMTPKAFRATSCAQ